MDIQKEREAFDQYFKEKYQEFHNEVFDENGDDRAIIGYSFAWSAWQAAKAQKVAVPEWNSYETKSPRIDGRYLIFVSGEQLCADFSVGFGFSSAEDGTAFIQELITHWAVPCDNPIEAQEQVR